MIYYITSKIPTCTYNSLTNKIFLIKYFDAPYAKLIREDKNSVFASYLVRFSVNPSIADSLYVGTIVESKIYKQFIKSQVTGSAQPQANAKVLGRFTFPLPPLSVQKAIAHILGSLVK